MFFACDLFDGQDIPEEARVTYLQLFESPVPLDLHHLSPAIDGMHTAVGNDSYADQRTRTPQEAFPDYDRRLVNHVFSLLPKCWHSVGADVLRDDLGNYDGVLLVFVRWYGTGERGFGLKLSPTELRRLRGKAEVLRLADAAIKPFLERESEAFGAR